MVEVIGVLTKEGDAILDNAALALERSNLRHFAEAVPKRRGAPQPVADARRSVHQPATWCR
jgi:hypothetical protein